MGRCTGNDSRLAFWRAVRQGRLHEYCEPCARRQNKPECPVIVDPVGIWERGGCWAFTESAAEVEAAEEAIRRYSKRRSA